MTAAAPPTQSWFTAPAPIRELFRRFPLQVYDAEVLPERAPDQVRQRAKLFVFSSPDDAARNLPSYNPTCLKWQTYLRMAKIPVDIVPSNNHASPSGALPYLLPVSSDSRPEIPLTGSRIAQYAQKHSRLSEERLSPREASYVALIANNIRPAWLYALYVCPAHTELLWHLYLPRLQILRSSSLYSLRAAARDEILKAVRRPLLLPNEIYSDAESAFAALSTLLGEDEWFFGGKEPRLFDAEVFAYTYLILDGRLIRWKDDSLKRCVSDFANLVRHQRRLYEQLWDEA